MNRFAIAVAILAAPMTAASMPATLPLARAAGADPHADGPERKTVADGEVGERIVEFVEGMAGEGFRGAVLAAMDGKVVAAVGVGSAGSNGEPTNTPATLFEIASLTKQFTAAAIMRLVIEGKLALNDSISVHLPDIPENARAITVEHLLRHTSGIPGTNAEGHGDDLAAVLPSFLRGGPQREPGTHWEYWNQGYALLSEIIARVSGMTYTDYLREAIFRPAGMHKTRFTGDEAPEGALVAIGRSGRGAPRSALDHPYGSYGFQYRGMGGVVTTVWDLWRWDRALAGDAPLDTKAKESLFDAGLNDYALGWFVRQDTQGRAVQMHGGGVRGFMAEMRRFPEQNALVVVLANRDDFHIGRVSQAVTELLFGDPLTVGSPLRGLAPELAEELAGRYEGERGRHLVIEVDGATTRARLHWSPSGGPVTRATIGRDADDRILLDDGSPARIGVEIERDEDGAIVALSVVGSRYRRANGPEAAGADAERRAEASIPIDRGMNVGIATQMYRMNELGVLDLPPTVRWRVLPRYVGIAEGGKELVDDRITVVIQDDANQFWPVIARMDLDVAEDLLLQLQAAIRSKKQAAE